MVYLANCAQLLFERAAIAFEFSFRDQKDHGCFVEVVGLGGAAYGG